jgi:hypothetical protein
MYLERRYSLTQVEYCRNFIFRRNFPIRRIFERSCELGLWRLMADRVSEIFGHRISKRLKGKLQVVLDQVEHGHHVFRAYFKNGFIKQYEKLRTFLRNEVCSNNLYDLGLRKGLAYMEEVREKLQQITDRFATFQASCLDVHGELAVLAKLGRQVPLGKSTVSGIKLQDVRVMRLLKALLHAGTHVAGARTDDLHRAVLRAHDLDPKSYRLSQLRYDLRKLRAHGLIERDGKRYAYRLTENGCRMATLLALFHQKIFGPLSSRVLRPATVHKQPPSKLEARLDRAAACIEEVIDYLRAA